nr:MAG TPA: helix-turn-helix domain protein [Caudoviricetes sp.]
MYIFDIKGIRKKKGISIRELSKKTNISRSYLSELENNKKINPTLQSLLKIASALNVNVKDLFYTRFDIEDLKKEMYKRIKKFGLESEEALEVSQLLDLVLNIKDDA